MRDSLTGAIIAAGRGDRLRSAAAALPKPLVEVSGEALLVRQIRMMLEMGISRVSVIINSETDRLRQEIGLTLPAGTHLLVADTPSSMESLLRLGDLIPPGRFLLSTVDTILSESELHRFFDRACAIADSSHPESGFDGALGVVPWRGDAKPLFVRLDSQSKIVEFGNDSQKLVTASVYLFSTRIFSYAAEARTQKLDALRRYLGLLVDKGLKLAGVPMSDVVDIDEPSDLEIARRMVAMQRGEG